MFCILKFSNYNYTTFTLIKRIMLKYLTLYLLINTYDKRGYESDY